MKQDLKSMTLAEMQDAFAAIGEPKFRAKQVFTWLHRGAVSFDAMTNLSKPLREKLDGLYDITAPSVARKQVSKLDGTIKYLWKLRDGNCVESVVMQYHHGNTVCISSEVGCPMGCKFCASTIGGLVRRLEPSELVDQVLFSQLDSGLPISNIVLMGIGEPLDNFDNVMRFLELINSPDGMNIGMRHISLSTCGLVDKIEKACRTGPAADALGLAPFAGRRIAQQDHARQPPLAGRHAARCLPRLFCEDGAPHLLRIHHDRRCQRLAGAGGAAFEKSSPVWARTST